METTPDRIQSVVQFIETVRPQIAHRVVPIEDMFGPTITDPDLECIVVSAETQKGGEMVNQERLKKVRSVSFIQILSQNSIKTLKMIVTRKRIHKSTCGCPNNC